MKYKLNTKNVFLFLTPAVIAVVIWGMIKFMSAVLTSAVMVYSFLTMIAVLVFVAAGLSLLQGHGDKK